LGAALLKEWGNEREEFQNGGQMVLLGRDAHLFDNEDDMVALAPLDDDRLSRLLRAVLGWFLETGKAVTSLMHVICGIDIFRVCS
jgi:hypothetical protein